MRDIPADNQKKRAAVLPAFVRAGDILHSLLAVRVGHLVDFSLGYDELNEKYCQDNGRTAEDPVRMFNYLTYLVWIQQQAFNL